ncbi:MAG: UDP-3-O-(3-hydroxymyristoyl)glucosamine N-acyltransferase [Planctomycetes bacterium]|jgi:UDP-3-O-[3-hydroxymyristoyl] glucosamine N-acyltransferase|nr:UDP-3-O-(3-hydroxymyristoyl)glucosamine N-acyltransferase [Planctomycetota bacterium]MCP4838251.1 UDP-3-O-(3-hydroxymyristoyl)glucosamine N-acyltransferase [Planctomycetota bacterium]
MGMTLQALADHVGAELRGDGDRIVERCAGIESAGPDEITFLANARYRSHLQTTQAGAVLVGPKVDCPDGLNCLISSDPYFAFRNAVIALLGFRQHPDPMEDNGAGISARAVIHPSAEVGDGTHVHPHAVVEAGASIGRGCHLYPGVWVGTGAVIGDDCILFPNAVVHEHCVLGNRVTLHAGVVIGNDGFGYATHAGEHHKIPQHGIVVLEDDVEIGGNCAIERAAIGETRIGRGTKFADLISIGHGTTIGPHCLLVSLVGVAGSVTLGHHVVLGGQTGVAGHLKVGDCVQVLAQSGIASDIPSDCQIGGAPAVSADTAKRNALASTNLADLFRRVKKLERAMDKA